MTDTSHTKSGFSRAFASFIMEPPSATGCHSTPKPPSAVGSIIVPEETFMQRAICIAAKGGGWVNPNPQVGAVIVKDSRIIAEGYHARFGEGHAERNAIAASNEPLDGAALYVTLEPCCHFGKTPPCTEAIIEQGFARVIIGSPDPNHLVAGKGAALLQEAGIEVVSGFMQDECDRLNQIFFHYIRTGTPYVTLKYAMTSDGKIATHTGASKWITGDEAREDVHRLRDRYAAIMVGIGTVLADDPLLNCRISGGHNPLRVICDSKLRIPPESQIVSTAPTLPTLIVTKVKNEGKMAYLKEQGCDVLVMPTDSKCAVSKQQHINNKNLQGSLSPEQSELDKKQIDLAQLMRILGERGIDSVLIEGGPRLHGSALEAGIVNKVRCYIAPKLFGGLHAPSPISGIGVSKPDEAYQLRNVFVETFGDDLCIEGELKRDLLPEDPPGCEGLESEVF